MSFRLSPDEAAQLQFLMQRMVREFASPTRPYYAVIADVYLAGMRHGIEASAALASEPPR